MLAEEYGLGYWRLELQVPVEQVRRVWLLHVRLTRSIGWSITFSFFRVIFDISGVTLTEEFPPGGYDYHFEF